MREYWNNGKMEKQSDGKRRSLSFWINHYETKALKYPFDRKIVGW
jgi:hypothetical protein